MMKSSKIVDVYNYALAEKQQRYQVFLWRLSITKMKNLKDFTKSKIMDNILKFSGFQGEFNATRYKFQLKNLKIAEMSTKTPFQISVQCVCLSIICKLQTHSYYVQT